MSFSSLLLFALISKSITVNVTTPEGPVEATVRLYMLEPGGSPNFQTEKATNKKGLARFETPKAAEGTQLMLTAHYAGLSYFSLPYLLSEVPRNIPIDVYDVRESDPEVVVSEVGFYLRNDERSLYVSQQIDIENPTKYAIIGKGGQNGEGTIKFELPSGAFDLSFRSGFSRETTEVKGNTVHIKSPLKPGNYVFDFEYRLEKDSSSFDLSPSISLPIQQLSVATKDPLFKFSGLNFIPAGSKFYEGEFMNILTAEVPKNGRASLKVSGLPIYIPWQKLGPFLGLLLLLCLVFFVSSKRDSTTAQASKEKQKEKLLHDLKFLFQLREKKLITQDEFQNRRLNLLRQVLPHYE